MMMTMMVMTKMNMTMAAMQKKMFFAQAPVMPRVSPTVSQTIATCT